MPTDPIRHLLHPILTIKRCGLDCLLTEDLVTKQKSGYHRSYDQECLTGSCSALVSSFSFSVMPNAEIVFPEDSPAGFSAVESKFDL